jgi:hypothetical protein
VHDVRVTTTLGSETRRSGGSAHLVANPVMPAQRASPPGWRDPRLWLGVAIIAVSVVAGARLLSAADNTTAVLAVDADLAPGDSITSGDVTSREVRFADETDLDRYVLATDSLPPGSRVTRSIASGELLARSALGSSLETGVIEIPIKVESGQVPPSVDAGSIVNVWVADELGDGDGADAVPEAVLVLEGVVVIEAPQAIDSFGATGERQLVIGVPADQSAKLPGALGAAASGRVVITRQG